MGLKTMSDNDQDNYNPGQKLDMKTIAEMDAEDESLRKYKEALLGKMDDLVSPSDDPRRVVIQKLIIIKEGCNFKIRVDFKVQHEIVSGLKYVNQVYRKGIRAVKEEEMLGSFGPQRDPHSVTFPKQGWDQAPKGALARGNYTAKTKFIDDDKQQHMAYEYSFQIKKDWK